HQRITSAEKIRSIKPAVAINKKARVNTQRAFFIRQSKIITHTHGKPFTVFSCSNGLHTSLSIRTPCYVPRRHSSVFAIRHIGIIHEKKHGQPQPTLASYYYKL